jgi:hypothetical protein
LKQRIGIVDELVCHSSLLALNMVQATFIDSSVRHNNETAILLLNHQHFYITGSPRVHDGTYKRVRAPIIPLSLTHLSTLCSITPILISRFMLDLREIGHDVPDPMDISYFAGPDLQRSLLGAEHSSTTTVSAIAHADGQDETNDGTDNVGEIAIDQQDIELPLILTAASNETTYDESVNGISEVCPLSETTGLVSRLLSFSHV